MVAEVWLQPDLQFAMVKSVLKDGGVMELGAQGTDAKSSITETPVEMPGIPAARRRTSRVDALRAPSTLTPCR